MKVRNALRAVGVSPGRECELCLCSLQGLGLEGSLSGQLSLSTARAQSAGALQSSICPLFSCKVADPLTLSDLETS